MKPDPSLPVPVIVKDMHSWCYSKRVILFEVTVAGPNSEVGMRTNIQIDLLEMERLGHATPEQRIEALRNMGAKALRDCIVSLAKWDEDLTKQEKN